MISALGYAGVVVFYAFLASLMLITGRWHRIGRYLMVASILGIAWGIVLAVQSVNGTFHPLAIAIAEVSRATAWIVFLVRIASHMRVARLLSSLSLAVCGAVVIGIVYGYWRESTDPQSIADMSTIMIPGELGISVLGLVLIEQLYRNSDSETRWALRPLVLGLGGIFAFDLFLYSQSLLLNSVDAVAWAARGYVNLLFVPMIAIAARRNSEWDLRIFVSRHVVFYSTTLTAVGIYLLLMSIGGYAIVRYGGSWGAVVQMVFFTGALLVLASLLFSNVLRARLKVFVNKHFFHNKYDYRDEWLNLVSTLAEFDNSSAKSIAIRALAQIVDSPAGVMWIRDGRSPVYSVNAYLDTDDQFPDVAFDDPLAQFLAARGWVVDLQEYARDPEAYRDLTIPDWLRGREQAWLLIPLKSTNELLGFVLLYKAVMLPNLNYEDRDLLKTAGSHVAVHLRQARADSLLAEAQQFEAYNRLTAFLMHDLNNLVAQQSLIVDNAKQHRRNPEFVDNAISTIAGSVERMKRIMRQLRTGASSEPAKLTELRFMVSAAIDRCAGKQPSPTLELNGVDGRLAVRADEMIMVFTHLFGNAQDACDIDGAVNVNVSQSDGIATVRISDDGAGMSTDFMRDRLFRPFDSTKGSQGMGIGAYQAREFVRSLGGDIEVKSEVEVGTVVTVSLPLATPSNPT